MRDVLEKVRERRDAIRAHLGWGLDEGREVEQELVRLHPEISKPLPHSELSGYHKQLTDIHTTLGAILGNVQRSCESNLRKTTLSEDPKSDINIFQISNLLSVIISGLTAYLLFDIFFNFEFISEQSNFIRNTLSVFCSVITFMLIHLITMSLLQLFEHAIYKMRFRREQANVQAHNAQLTKKLEEDRLYISGLQGTASSLIDELQRRAAYLTESHSQLCQEAINTTIQGIVVRNTTRDAHPSRVIPEFTVDVKQFDHRVELMVALATRTTLVNKIPMREGVITLKDTKPERDKHIAYTVLILYPYKEFQIHGVVEKYGNHILFEDRIYVGPERSEEEVQEDLIEKAERQIAIQKRKAKLGLEDDLDALDEAMDERERKMRDEAEAIKRLEERRRQMIAGGIPEEEADDFFDDMLALIEKQYN